MQKPAGAPRPAPDAVAVLGDDGGRCDLLRHELADDGIALVVCASRDELVGRLRSSGVRCVLLFEEADTPTPPDLLVRLRRESRSVPILVVAARAEIATAVATIRSGASDLLEAPSATELTAAVRAAASSPARDGPGSGGAGIRVVAAGAGARLPLSRPAARGLGLEPGPGPAAGSGDVPLTEDGWLTLPTPRDARRLAHRIALRRPHPEPPAPSAGELFATALVAGAMHRLLRLHLASARPGALQTALRRLRADFGGAVVRRALLRFVDAFPPLAVRTGGATAAAWIEESAEGRPNEETALSQLLLVRSLNRNRAAGPVRELFDDSALAASLHPYAAMAEELGELLRAAGRTCDADPGPLPADVAEVAAEPSLSAQLALWADLLGPSSDLGREMQVARGILAEERRPPATGLPGPPPSADYRDPEEESERFAAESPWMAGLVLVAKSLRVWLAQLSRESGRPVRRLDEIPEEALRALADQGITGLWLVGLWERSVASRRIKIALGDDPEAGASAYAVRRYRVAADLGGTAALESLRKVAWRHGIRLGADVVPNHTAIDSDWLLEHPDWFLSLPESPFPGYRFSGPDLSPDPRVGLYLEDGYSDRSDAAVVFRRVDHATGEVRYVYHGNDGTGLPWNDTAQIDFLHPGARRAVLAAIVDAALTFPILRIDSAMCLARRHIHRLWHPEPGAGGAIPSRSEHGLSRTQLHRRMPRELWGEVTEAVARAAPDTLLLAEAFWLMERYFVRSLGMHRVYDSGFLRDLAAGDVATLRRRLARSSQEPELFRRLAHYLTIPEEPPAAATFGTGARYLAAATLQATLPGLPLLGHGQLEGLRERYGMEQERPKLDESPRPDRLAVHRDRIAPLLARRTELAGAAGFRTWDLRTPDGEIVQEVVAYSHGEGRDATLTVVHYRDATVRGRLVDATPAATAAAAALADTLAPAAAPNATIAWSELRGRGDRGPLLPGCGRLPRSVLAAEGLPLELGPWEVALLSRFRERPRET